jgi:maltooligosyltrehalose trehalohydrolase
MSGTSSFGARVYSHDGGGVRFSVPAPRAKTCGLRLFDASGTASPRNARLGLHLLPRDAIPMHRTHEGAFEADVPGLSPHARYRYVLDGEDVGDPFARFFPEGVDQPASVESLAYEWTHPALGATDGDVSIYELHIGTFTEEGTYRAAAKHLAELADLGARAVELMPLAAFAGLRGWGYDGVAHYAPFAPYGSPEDLAAFVDEAHGLGLRVLLDVVYNHFGPAGNWLRRFVPDAFTTRFSSPWGESPDFANPILRGYVLGSVRYWLEEFRFDGVRLDATHTIHDDGDAPVLREIARLAHAYSPRRLAIAEDERNDPALVREQELDAIWADDFHHQIHVALTREQDGYYGAYSGDASDLARTIERGWFYSGEVYPASGEPRGSPASGLDAPAFAYCIQNHDQIGNRARGERLSRLTDLDGFAAASLVLLLLPMTPILFMGQEWGATSRFLYFTDHAVELGRLVTEGRRKEFARFDAFRDAAARETIPDPQSERTWTASRLDWSERTREPHARILALYRTLLRLRRDDVVLRDRARARMRAWSHGAVLVVDRWSGETKRRVVANLTGDPSPLDDLARGWRLVVATSSLRLPATSLPKRTAALFEPESEAPIR